MSKQFKQIAKNIYLVSSKSSKDLAKLFIRFQEYYESPEFKGKIFTLLEFEQWYKKHKNTEQFTYYEDWSGFNVPGNVIEFVRDNFPNLSEDEKWLIDQISKVHSSKAYYVIGASHNSKKTLKHEIAHAMFYTNTGYRWIIKKIIKENNHYLQSLEEYLINLGYNESVIEDEKHAYLLTERKYLIKNKIWTEDFEMISYLINNEFERFK